MKPAILVLVGITGDLSKRKLLPALAKLAAADKLPEQFRVIGITRKPSVDTAAFLANVPDKKYLEDHLTLFHMDLEVGVEYERLAAKLAEVEADFGTLAQRLFYLSVPPKVSEPIIEHLGTSGIAEIADTKLLLEKPSGTDFATAKKHIAHIGIYFNEDQVYRIDHYLAKDFAQDMVRTRQADTELEAQWNKDFVRSIEIVASEKIGIEGRAGFYEQTGALLDLVQSHLLQLAALTLMRLPRAIDQQPIERLAALTQLSLVTEAMHLGQYEGYRTEAGNEKSVVETFVSLTLTSSDPRWLGVPVTLTTGKELDTKATEIRIYPLPGDGVPQIFAETDRTHDAYESVFLAAFRSERSLFVSSAEVLACWRIIAPVQEAWKVSKTDLRSYPKGSTPSAI